MLAVAVAAHLLIPFEQKEPDYLLWAPLRSSSASSSTPAGCLLQLKHGLDDVVFFTILFF
jgi:hypothetical protein